MRESNFCPMHPSGLKQGWNSRHWLVLQDSLSMSAVVQMDVLPPFCATLQGLVLLRRWSKVVFSWFQILRSKGNCNKYILTGCSVRPFSDPGIQKIWGNTSLFGNLYRYFPDVVTMRKWKIHHRGMNKDCVFAESNIRRKENDAHPSATCSAAAAPRAPVTPRGVHRRCNWPWEQKTDPGTNETN